MAVRKIPIQSRAIAGNFYSYKNRKTIKYESQLEKKIFLLLEFDNNVIYYEEQPLKVKNYIPDILIHTKEGLDILVEVKYQSEIDKEEEKLLKKVEELKSYCAENNLEFKFYTDKDIVEPYFFNISLLYNYSNEQVPQGVEEFILDVLKTETNDITLGNLISDYGINVSHIYNLAFQEKLFLNLHKKITNTSIVKAMK